MTERVWKRSRPVTEPEVVRLGSHVVVELVTDRGENERLAFDIVPDDQADLASGLLAINSRLAQAILGHGVGSLILYQIEDVREIRILEVAPSRRSSSRETAETRQAIIREAVRKSDLENAIRFALSVDVKWGETDPEGIVANWD